MAAKWKQILGEVAPTIASFWGGKYASTATKAVLDVFGLGPEASQKEIEKALATASPEQLVELRRVDTQFQARMKELDLKADGLDVENTKSARDRYVQMRDRAPAILAAIVTLGFFGSLAALFIMVLPDKQTQIILFMLGALTNEFARIMNFFFGSSTGSKDKDAHHASLMSKIVTGD